MRHDGRAVPLVEGSSMRYEPTPEQIREACRKIREQWDDREYARRAGLSEQSLHWTPPGPVRVCLADREKSQSSD